MLVTTLRTTALAAALSLPMAANAVVYPDVTVTTLFNTGTYISDTVSFSTGLAYDSRNDTFLIADNGDIDNLTDDRLYTFNRQGQQIGAASFGDRFARRGDVMIMPEATT